MCVRVFGWGGCVYLHTPVCVCVCCPRTPPREPERANTASPTGLLYTTGLYYVPMLNEYGKSRSYTAWMGSLTNAFFMLGGKCLRSPQSPTLGRRDINNWLLFWGLRNVMLNILLEYD